MCDFVYPSEVFAAIEEAKRRNPKDTLGVGALQFKLDALRSAKNGVRFFSVNILKFRAGKWEYIPLVMKYMNIPTVANIYENGHEKRKYAAVSLTFKRSTAKFMRGETEEHYGDAIVALYEIFEHVMKQFKKTTKIALSNKIVRSIVQKTYKDSKTEEQKNIDPAEYMFRVELPFNYSGEGQQRYIKNDEPPKCDVYDTTVKVAKPKSGDLPFLKNAYKKGEQQLPLQYGNIHDFIKAGSCLSGLHDMRNACLSSQGLSWPGKMSLLVVKPSRGNRPEAAKVFDASEFGSMEDAETADVEDENETIPQESGEKEADVDVNALTEAADELEDESFEC